MLCVSGFAQSDYNEFSTRKNAVSTRAHGSLTELLLQGYGMSLQQLRAPRSEGTAAEQPITGQPAGTLHANQYKWAKGFYPFYGTPMYDEYDGFTSQYVVAGDGSVYLYSPFAAYDTHTWLKMEPAEGDTLVVNTPQLIYQEEYKGELYSYYAATMVGNNQDKDYTVKEPGQVKFVLRNDTLYKTGTDVLGLVSASGGWTGFGDDSICVHPVGLDMVQLPAGAVLADYVLTSHTSASEVVESVVRMAFVGDEAYLTPSASKPDAWVKGSVVDGKVTFAGLQYLGVDATTDMHTFFSPVEYKLVEDPKLGLYDSIYTKESMVFVGNSDMTSLTCSDLSYFVNLGKYSINIQDFIKQPSLDVYVPSTANPQNPVITDYRPYDDMYGYGGIMVEMQKLDVEGKLMKASNLFYNVFFDDQLFTFTTDVYSRIPADMTDVPIDFNDEYDFYRNSATSHTVYFYFGNFNKISFQMVYRDGDDVRRSDMVSYYPNGNGIGGASADSRDIIKETFTDLSGRSMSAPSHGVYVKTTWLGDGTRRSVKVIR